MHELERGADVPDALGPYLAVDRSRPRHECWVTGHMVAGLDGTAAVGGRVGSLSTTPDQALFRRMRQIADIVLVGAETVRREGYGPVRLDDEAQAQRRRQGQSPTPPLAVVSRSLAFDWTAKAFADAPDDARTHVITCAAADSGTPGGGREGRGQSSLPVTIASNRRPRWQRWPSSATGWCSARAARRGSGELVAADRLDELCLSIAPLMGGDPLPVSVTPPGAGLAEFELKGTMAEDDTVFLRYERKPR